MNPHIFCRLRLHWWQYSWSTVPTPRGRVVVLHRVCSVCGARQRHRVDKVKNGHPVWDEVKLA